MRFKSMESVVCVCASGRDSAELESEDNETRFSSQTADSLSDEEVVDQTTRKMIIAAKNTRKT